MFKIEENIVYYRYSEGQNWFPYGKEVSVFPTDIDNQMEIKKFDLKSGEYVHCDDYDQWDYDGDIYTVIGGYFTAEVKPIPPTTEELIMQALTDIELTDLDNQMGQELLSQQLTDIELLLLEKG